MKVIEVNGQPLNLDELVEAAQEEEILLLRDGRPLVRLEKFDQRDWEDFQYESSAEALERGKRARTQYAGGEYKKLEELKEKYAAMDAAEKPE